MNDFSVTGLFQFVMRVPLGTYSSGDVLPSSLIQNVDFKKGKVYLTGSDQGLCMGSEIDVNPR